MVAAQYFYSAFKSEGVYFIRAIPDLVFRKQGTTAGIAFVYNDTDVAEIKLGSHLPCSGGIAKACAQMTGELYFIATAIIFKALRKGRNPTKTRHNGLLVNKNTEMMFFSLEATIGGLDVARLMVKYRRASFINEDLTLGLICKGITETLMHS